MADINFCIQPEATESENLIQGTGTGLLSNINDNNESTYRQIYNGDENIRYIEFEHEIDFGVNVSINSVAVVSRTVTPIGAGITDYYIYLYYNSQWNLVYTGPTGEWSKTTHTQNGTWVGVTKIKVYWKGSSGPFLAGHEIWLRDFELRAWGTTYIDIGLRVRTSSGTIKIGVKDLEASHKLRIRKGGTTYGIPLLATNDSNASGLRIWDGAVKAPPKVD